MYQLSCEINIGAYTFSYVNKLQVASSREKLTDTASIIVPNKLSLEGKPVFIVPKGSADKAIFNVGDPVTIKLGYDQKFNTVFQGFLTSIKPKKPVELGFEDQLWIFKRFSMKKSFRAGTSLQTVLDYIHTQGLLSSKLTPTIQGEAGVKLGNFSLNNQTGAQAFEILRKDYNLTTYAHNGQVYCRYLTTVQQEAKINIPFTFQDNIVSHDLTYKQANDIKIKAKATSIDLKTNKRIEVTAGDADGEVRSLFQVGMTKEALQAWADNEVKKYKYDGYYGKFTGFGEPFTRWGDTVLIKDTVLPEHDGAYLVKEVNYSFGTDGYRQEIELDQKVG